MSLSSLRGEGGSGTYTDKQQQHEQHKAVTCLQSSIYTHQLWRTIKIVGLLGEDHLPQQ